MLNILCKPLFRGSGGNTGIYSTNNMAERDMRKFKNKAKVSGCFRSAEGTQIYARIASVITTLKKQSINVFDGLCAVYSGQIPISTA